MMQLTFETLYGREWLFLDRLYEPEENALTLVVIEATVAAEAREHETGIRAREVDPNIPAAIFELRWSDYIAYAVRDESYALPDDYESFDGAGAARTYARSRFLDFIAASTRASASDPGPFRHYGLLCQNHTVDVVSASEPSVATLDRGSCQERRQRHKVYLAE